MSKPAVVARLRPTVTRSVLRAFVTVAVLVFGSNPVAEATPFTVTYVMTVTLTGGQDLFGLESATLTLTAGFDTADTYVDLLGSPGIVAGSHSLAISGASVAGTDGTYSFPGGLAFHPTVDGQWGGATAPLIAAVNGGDVSLGVLFTSVAGIDVGDPIALSHFGTTASGNSSIFSAPALAQKGAFEISSLAFSSETAPVPEPASLTLLGLGLAGMAGRRWRQRKAS